jgi:hypothetical protein
VGPLEIVAVNVTASPYVDGEPELATVNAGVVALICRVKFSERLPEVAVKVTDSAFATDDTVAVNKVLVAFSGTVTVAGTVTSALLLDRFTVRPPEGAAAFRVIVHESVPEAAIDALVQETPLNSDAIVPLCPVPDVPETDSVFV